MTTDISTLEPAERFGLASFACDWRHSRGRLLAEPGSPTRSDFQRDRDRIIHSDAFRRLMHKTQVFVHNQNDHFRTRLTHTLEVGQIARALARSLNVDEDLTEALALVHDFGHTPFGHAGERALSRCMEPWGGFEHNAQSLRVVTALEHRYAGFDGLNLTWEVLEGLVKHNGPLTDRDGDPLDEPVPGAIAAYSKRHDLQLWSWPSVEAQCAAIADDIAYDNHDLDDGLRSGLFEIDDLGDVPLCAEILHEISRDHPNLERSRMIHELVRRQITRMVEDVIAEASGRLSEAAPVSSDEVRKLDYAIVAFSPVMEVLEKEHKRFMYRRMYRHPKVMGAVAAAEQVVEELFQRYFDDSTAMPADPEWRLENLDGHTKAGRIADYIAGMTDRYAMQEHRRLFDRTPQLG